MLDATFQPIREEIRMSDSDIGDTEQTRKDTSYSPASEEETQAKQDGSQPEAIDPDAAEKVKVAPGTGGPDDGGDVEVNEEDVNLPPFGESPEAPD
jgi:N-acetylmuramoyl-L-alanine amidase